MIDMSTTMEVNQWLKSNLGSDILLLLCGLDLLRCSIEAIDVCLVVVLVVQLHDLAGDGWLKRTVVIYRCQLARVSVPESRHTDMADLEE